jgi:hypothetical protein
MNELGKRSSSNVKLFSILAVVVVLLIALIAIPNSIRVHPTTPQSKCINNLRLFDGAKQQWALEKNKTEADAPTWADIWPYFGLKMATNFHAMPKCPSGGTYILGAMSNAPTCSIPGHVLP